jgi:hypothetical protein
MKGIGGSPGHPLIVFQMAAVPELLKAHDASTF